MNLMLTYIEIEIEINNYNNLKKKSNIPNLDIYSSIPITP